MAFSGRKAILFRRWLRASIVQKLNRRWRWLTQIWRRMD